MLPFLEISFPFFYFLKCCRENTEWEESWQRELLGMGMFEKGWGAMCGIVCTEQQLNRMNHFIRSSFCIAFNWIQLNLIACHIVITAVTEHRAQKLYPKQEAEPVPQRELSRELSPQTRRT